MTSGGRSYGRALAWGIETGAVTGAVVGALLFLQPAALLWSPFLTPVGAAYGAIVGAVVAVLPSLLGADGVKCVLSYRHGDRPSRPDVERDLRWLFAVVVGLLDVVAVALLAGGGAGFEGVLEGAHFLVAGDAALVFMLCRANRDLSEIWAAG